MSDFSSYFGSYARQSPARAVFISETGIKTPGFTEEEAGERRYETVTPVNYPKLYEALKEECEFRGVEMPACYIDHTGGTRLGCAFHARYYILIEPAAYEIFDKKELRALCAHEIKHLYQSPSETPEESRANELDSDRAAVTSTDYATIRSYVHKAIELQISQKLPAFLQPLALAFHHTFPNFAAEKCFVRIDSSHPSPATRMRAMRICEQDFFHRAEATCS